MLKNTVDSHTLYGRKLTDKFSFQKCAIENNGLVGTYFSVKKSLKEINIQYKMYLDCFHDIFIAEIHGALCSSVYLYILIHVGELVWVNVRQSVGKQELLYSPEIRYQKWESRFQFDMTGLKIYNSSQAIREMDFLLIKTYG